MSIISQHKLLAHVSKVVFMFHVGDALRRSTITTPSSARCQLRMERSPNGDVIVNTSFKQRVSRPSITQEKFDAVFNEFLACARIDTSRLHPKQRLRLLEQIAASDSADNYRNLKKFFWERLTELRPDPLNFSPDKTAALIFRPGLSQLQYSILKLCFPKLGLSSWDDATSAADKFGSLVVSSICLHLSISAFSAWISMRFFVALVVGLSQLFQTCSVIYMFRLCEVLTSYQL